MADTFHSCEITPIGISIKVLRDGIGHRRSLGVGDFASKADYITAVSAMLEAHLGKSLAAVAAVVSANKDDKEQAIAALEEQHAAQLVALEADIATLGTKEEAAEMRKAKAVAALQAEIAAKNAELAKLLPAESEPVDLKR